MLYYDGARWEVAKYTRLKNYKLSSLAVYTEGAKCTIFFHEIQVQGKLTLFGLGFFGVPGPGGGGFKSPPSINPKVLMRLT